MVGGRSRSWGMLMWYAGLDVCMVVYRVTNGAAGDQQALGAYRVHATGIIDLAFVSGQVVLLDSRRVVGSTEEWASFWCVGSLPREVSQATTHQNENFFNLPGTACESSPISQIPGQKSPGF